MKEVFNNIDGFEWDINNIDKNWLKHLVHFTECEEIFFNDPVIIMDDLRHSENEDRYYSLGRTKSERLLFVVFTLRGNKIRVISARDMNKNERKIYNEKTEKNT